MKKSFILPVILVFLISSCELIDDVLSDESVIDKIEGQWGCDEVNDMKSTKAEGHYEVYISPDPDDSTQVLISNFFALGDNIEATAKVSGTRLTLSRQTLPGDFKILSGSGTITSGYDKINWTYSIDDGSGVPINATATYTKVY